MPTSVSLQTKVVFDPSLTYCNLNTSQSVPGDQFNVSITVFNDAGKSTTSVAPALVRWDIRHPANGSSAFNSLVWLPYSYEPSLSTWDISWSFHGMYPLALQIDIFAYGSNISLYTQHLTPLDLTESKMDLGALTLVLGNGTTALIRGQQYFARVMASAPGLNDSVAFSSPATVLDYSPVAGNASVSVSPSDVLLPGASVSFSWDGFDSTVPITYTLQMVHLALNRSYLANYQPPLPTSATTILLLPFVLPQGLFVARVCAHNPPGAYPVPTCIESDPIAVDGDPPGPGQVWNGLQHGRMASQSSLAVVAIVWVSSERLLSIAHGTV